MIRHLERMHQVQPRLFTSMTGGAAGTFATPGEIGPAAQEGVARRLGLRHMAVPSRNIADHFAELVCVRGMLASTAASIAEEVARLMAVEFGEVSEPVPDGHVGSSTMPQKRNPKLCGGGRLVRCAGQGPGPARAGGDDPLTRGRRLPLMTATASDRASPTGS
jgi:adenylosuccinate lyase